VRRLSGAPFPKPAPCAGSGGTHTPGSAPAAARPCARLHAEAAPLRAAPKAGLNRTELGRRDNGKAAEALLFFRSRNRGLVVKRPGRQWRRAHWRLHLSPGGRWQAGGPARSRERSREAACAGLGPRGFRTPVSRPFCRWRQLSLGRASRKGGLAAFSAAGSFAGERRPAPVRVLAVEIPAGDLPAGGCAGGEMSSRRRRGAGREGGGGLTTPAGSAQPPKAFNSASAAWRLTVSGFVGGRS